MTTQCVYMIFKVCIVQFLVLWHLMSEFSTVLTEKRCSRTAVKVLDYCAECSTVVTNNWNHVNQSSVLNYSFWDVATCWDMNAVWSILGLKWLKETQKMIFREFRNIQKTLSESSFLVMLPVQCCKYIFFSFPNMMCDMCTVLVGHPVFLADMLFMVFWTLIVVHTPSVQFFYQLWLHPKAFASTERALSECDLGPLLISQMKFFATIALATRSSISDNDRHPESGFSCHLNYHSLPFSLPFEYFASIVIEIQY